MRLAFFISSSLEERRFNAQSVYQEVQVIKLFLVACFCFICLGKGRIAEVSEQSTSLGVIHPVANNILFLKENISKNTLYIDALRAAHL